MTNAPRLPAPTPGDTVTCPLHTTGACSSCPHLDTPVALQLAGKQERVTAVLGDRVPDGAWLPPAASAPERFRNRAKMAVSGTSAHPVLGILDRDGRGTDLRTCPLHLHQIEEVLPVLARLVTALHLTPYDVRSRRGELKYVLVTASPDGELMVRLVLRSTRHVPALREATAHLQRLVPGLAVFSVNIQPQPAAVIEGEREIVLSRRSDLPMRLTLPSLGTEGRVDGGPSVVLPLHLPPRSFFQTNTGVAQALYGQARTWAADDGGAGGSDGERPQVVWDLYCGVGGFALALAGSGRRVRGVEVSANAIEGARRAAVEMGLGPELVGFEAGDATVLDPATGVRSGAGPDLLVVNPPRRGIGAELAVRVETSGVRRVLYSSCNPVSLARDLEAMPSLRVARARLFDMFPHTDHAEVLVELRRV